LLFNVLLNLLVIDFAVALVMFWLRVADLVGYYVFVCFVQSQRRVVLDAGVAARTLLAGVESVFSAGYLRFGCLWSHDCPRRFCSVKSFSLHFLIDLALQVIKFNQTARFTRSLVSATHTFGKQTGLVSRLLRPFAVLLPSAKHTLPDFADARLRPLLLVFVFA
jgi:hypothetical protein